jgi:hypothetical protein
MTGPFPEFTYQIWMEIRKYTLFSPCHFGLWVPFPAPSLFLLILHLACLKSVLTMSKCAALVFLVYSPRTIRCSSDFDWFYLIKENDSRPERFFLMWGIWLSLFVPIDFCISCYLIFLLFHLCTLLFDSPDSRVPFYFHFLIFPRH